MYKSKGKTLLFLKSKRFNVPDTYLIKANSFIKKKSFFIKKINTKFGKKKIAIRSSSVDEDTTKTTNAGKFQSYLNVSPLDRNDVETKICNVIKSYKSYSNKNEVIIQNMVTNVAISGVCTTADIHNYLPIITINYHKGKDTEVVTSGKKNSFSINIADKKYINKKNDFYKLLKEVDKLKKVFNNDLLDVEFAIDKRKKLHILQVRKLILPKNKEIVSKKFYYQNLERLKKKINKLQKKNYDLFGNKNYFGVMPDWNPAEIIGTKPRPLALTLYKELITDHIWSKHRDNYGFKNVESHHLMTTFFGTPYIDVRVDFNSWIPKKINSKLSQKIINFYLSKFKKNKDFHDKIEFKILFTCFTPNTNSRIKKELENKLEKKELKEFKSSLKNINNIAFKESKKDLEKIKNLDKSIYKISKLNTDSISIIYFLIEECKKNGTVAFAGLARCGFIAIDILNSLVDNKILSISEKNRFLNSIKNIATKVNNDFVNLSRKEFSKINGHLRPNTYDIMTPNYEEGYKIYFNKKNRFKNKNVIFNFSKKQKKYISDFLKKNNFNLNTIQFVKFLKDSIYLREYSKFIFTKCIDLVFKNLINFGKKYKIDRNDLSYLNIRSILELHDNLDSIFVIDDLKDEIKKNKIIFKNNSLMHLPETITSTKDLYIYEKNNNSGNFITQKSILGELLELDNFENIKKIEKKILLIESADPGYDFIFSKKIKGLITKYGGQNSHMSIRASELGLPAAIGVGEEIFNSLKNKKYITLDCLNKKLY
ncbi:PEP-utilizing enzyme [Candidatus Pelagibacter sp. HIMB1623]|uniref:PEP-utilizing enzyme n=1 Tax=Candidatus Pelagibacter sp. HIMB1623 TaxID=3413358 RepID=UPI003F861FEC